MMFEMAATPIEQRGQGGPHSRPHSGFGRRRGGNKRETEGEREKAEHFHGESPAFRGGLLYPSR
jgi:hypothetical protein